MKQPKEPQKTEADPSAMDRPQWTFSVASQRRSVSTLKWGARRRPRYAVIAIILLIQAIVVSMVIYFNATVSIPETMLRSVGVNVLAPSSPASPTSP